MKVLICSDSHTRLDYFQKVMNLEEPEIVIFAGDHSTDAIDMALVYSEIPFKIVKGNTDYYDHDTKDTEIFELNDLSDSQDDEDDEEAHDEGHTEKPP